MIRKVSSAIIKNFEAIGIVNDENREIYLFGVQQGLMLVINFVSMLLVGVLFRQWFQCILYMALFIPLRSFAGGYHACSSRRCYVYSVLSMILAMLIMKLPILSISLCYGIAIISGLIIFILAPVEDHNKPFDNVEIIHYRVRARVTLVLECLFLVLSCVLKWKTGVICTTLALLTINIMLLAGIIKNLGNKRRQF